MQIHDGLWWPDSDKRGRPAIVAGAAEGIPVVLQLVKGRSVCVQAGGNVGVYPLALAEHFEAVLTFEPDPDNYKCLLRNTERPARIVTHRSALSDVNGVCHMQIVEADNCGAHKVMEGGTIPTMTIDSLALQACDLIWLDIEGHEAKAIEGARKTIERFSPVIVLEEKGLGAKASLPGYTVVGRVGNDTIYRRL